MLTVTISRQFGSGGWTLGERLCQKFGYRLVNESAIDEMARREKVSPNWLSAIEKEAGSSFLSMISNMVSSGIFYRTPCAPGEDMERRKYVDFLTRVMTPLANQGGFVIVGRGAQFILKGHPKVIHVMLVGDFQKRVRFVADRFGFPLAEAEEIVREKERQRAALATNIFETNIEDTSLYHIVLNTSLLPFEWAVETVSTLLTLRTEQERGVSTAAPT